MINVAEIHGVINKTYIEKFRPLIEEGKVYISFQMSKSHLHKNTDKWRMIRYSTSCLQLI